MHQLAIATFARDPNDRVVLLPTAEHQLAIALHGAGRTARALATFASALAAFETHYPPDYLLAANLGRDYGAALVDAGRPAEAIPLLHRAIDVLAARWGDYHFARSSVNASRIRWTSGTRAGSGCVRSTR